MGEGGEKSRSDLRDGVRCAWAKPSLDAITTSNARMASGSPETFPAPCARATRASAKQKSYVSLVSRLKFEVRAVVRHSRISDI